MRLAVLLLASLPAVALAQPAPPAKPATTVPAKPAPKAVSTPATAPPPKPASPKPAPPKPATPAGVATKPAPKPAVVAKKPPPSKPAARKPAAAPHPVAPVPAPATVNEPPAEPNKGSNTGLPLPRFAALRSDDVNFRSGPGTRYPIEWVYKRRDLPVEIEREFEIWRLVEDPLGNKGWVHQATLTGRRTAVVAAGPERMLRQTAADSASAVAKLKPGVILRLRSCEATSEWCQAQIGDYRGFIRRSEIWGVLPGEVIQ